jgi:uncharacterized protein YjbI with pentapeptide repeats
VNPNDAQPPRDAPLPDSLTESSVPPRPTVEIQTLRGVFQRVLTREPIQAPFIGKKLGRAEVQEVLMVALETGSTRGVDLRGADLQGADLSYLNLANARLGDDDPLASVEERNANAAKLDGANLTGASLENAVAVGISLAGANLRGAKLAGANLLGANLVGANLREAHCEGSRLTEALLTGANCEAAHFEDAILVGARCMQANLRGAFFAGADLGLVNLTGADLRQSSCNEQTYLGGTLLQGALLDGWRLRETDLTAVDWSAARAFGEEEEANKALLPARATAFRVAARTYQHLGLALRAQGMTAEGQRLTARARVMEERALWAESANHWKARRRVPATLSFVRGLGNAVQGVLTAYGERPGRALLWGLGAWLFFAGLLLFAPDHPPFGLTLLWSGSALVGHGYTQLPTIFVQPGFIATLGLIEAGVGTLLELLFVVGLVRKTIG